MKKFLLSLVLALAICLSCASLALAADSELYRPNPDCGEYLGRDADGTFLFRITIPADRQMQPTPLVLNHYYSIEESSNTDVVYMQNQYFVGRQPGEADVIYLYQENTYTDYNAKAIVHVTVLSQEDYDKAGIDKDALRAANIVKIEEEFDDEFDGEQEKTKLPEEQAELDKQAEMEQTVPEQQAQTAAGGSNSGSLSLSKLSQEEIRQLLANAPQTDFSDAEIYEQLPSYTAPYAIGKLKSAPLQAVLARLNALRRIAGLPAVALDNSLTEKAQYGAVLSAAYGKLSHNPSKPADMDDSFYRVAYEATSSSNLSAGRILTVTPDAFMDDSDASNIECLGHRRWQLNPNMGKTGFGYVTTDSGYSKYTAEWSFDNSGDVDYDFISWPASGNFPSDLFTGNIAWSVTVNPNKYQTPSKSSVKVTLTRQSDGQSWTFAGSGYTPADSGSYFNVETNGYAVANCIIFRPDGISSYDGAYTVEISGLRTSSGQQTSLQYQVDFFSVGESTPSQPSKPSNNQQNNNNNNNQNNQNNNNNNNNVNNNQNNNGGLKRFDPQNAGNPFSDVHNGDYFRDTVLWAVQRGVTKGTSATTFEPYTKCSNADIITMLWRLYSGEESSASNPFNSVRSSDYYYQPALWAWQMGMVTDRDFNWSHPCTRGTTMRFIWIAAGKMEYSGSLPFSDVSGEFKMPVAWAWSADIAKGTTDTTFEPNATCTRAEIATFLYRAFGGTL